MPGMPSWLPMPKIGKWSRRSSERVASFRVFDVHRHEMTDAAGRPRREVFCFECPDWCNVVALTEQDELVLVWQYRFGTDTMGLELPGGVIERGEDPAHAALRELREETGYVADEVTLLSTVQPNPALQNNLCHTFLALGAKKLADTDFDENEECEVALVSAEHAEDLITGNHVEHALCVVGLEAFLRSRRKNR
jgi:8-oxo-dGTP pyrophosphatase MutT (NUDIX family)